MEENSELRLDDIVKITVAEGQVFYLEKRYADMSHNIKAGLGCNSIESITKEFMFSDIRPDIMEKVIQYLHFKFKYQQLLDRKAIKVSQVPKFELEPEMALDVLVAASYLQA
ncbi:hypothetical protein SteCoe_24259 [Stentor coeruleus]|uniref:Elongin-C n=1 Tax=Stentor coeruleus TaxID=5963 RepID=A0A1R2BI26_9CILI|nr:hypothetical protein SteCoe_24259 [Stentor coeruleus]